MSLLSIGLLLTFMPNWVMDVSDCVTQSLSPDEAELPELDIDPRALLASKSSNICDGVSNTGLYTNKQKIGKSNTFSECENNITDNSNQARRCNNQNILDELKQSSFVFDPVFGVIPRETRDLWVASVKSNSSSNSNSKTPITSVMSELPDSSVDNTSKNAYTDKSVSKKLRVLPPVRYSNVDSSSSRSVTPLVSRAT